MRRHQPPERREPGAAAPTRTPEPSPAEVLLALQRGAGNRAVSGLLARQPVPTDAGPKPGSTEKGATMTVGLGENIVIPLEAASWGPADPDGKLHELAVVFVVNDASSELAEAEAKGRRFETGFFSTQKWMSRMTNIMLSNFSSGPTGDGGPPIVKVTLDFDSVEHEPVKMTP